VLCPKSICDQWAKEFAKVRSWIGLEDLSEITRFKSSEPIILRSEIPEQQRFRLVEEWKKKGEVLICTYDMYRNCLRDNSAKYMPYFLDPGPDLVVLDEGHKIRNNTAGITRVLKSIASKKRIVMTGYPLQNNLLEYYTMIDFVSPGLLGGAIDFKRKFRQPIENAHFKKQITVSEKKAARKMAFILHDRVDRFMLRRDASFLIQRLPKKYEIVLNIRLSDAQQRIYEQIVSLIEQSPMKLSVLWYYNLLTWLCNHPDILFHYYKNLQDEREKKDQKSFVTSITAAPAASTSASSTSSTNPPTTTSGTPEKNQEELEEELFNDDDDETDEQMLKQVFDEAKMEILDEIFKDGYTKGNVMSGGKMLVLFSLIFQARDIQDKLVVFSRSIDTLNFVEISLVRFNQKYEKDNGKKINFRRLDGSTGSSDRQKIIEDFNNKSMNYHVLLISTLAGGEGINLCSANRLVLMDVNWNPSNDCQACCRVFRFGQEKEVFIYRLITEDTIEEKVHQRQVKKQTLSDWVLDDGSLESTADSSADIQKLLTIPKVNTDDLEPVIDEDINDPFLETVLQKHAKYISRATLQEHLFREDPSFVLTEQEKNAYREQYEFDCVYGSNSTPRRKESVSKSPVKQPVKKPSTRTVPNVSVPAIPSVPIPSPTTPQVPQNEEEEDMNFEIVRDRPRASSFDLFSRSSTPVKKVEASGESDSPSRQHELDLVDENIIRKRQRQNQQPVVANPQPNGRLAQEQQALFSRLQKNAQQLSKPPHQRIQTGAFRPNLQQTSSINNYHSFNDYSDDDDYYYHDHKGSKNSHKRSDHYRSSSRDYDSGGHSRYHHSGSSGSGYTDSGSSSNRNKPRNKRKRENDSNITDDTSQKRMKNR
jgi:hypothetical protein